MTDLSKQVEVMASQKAEEVLLTRLRAEQAKLGQLRKNLSELKNLQVRLNRAIYETEAQVDNLIRATYDQKVKNL